MDIIIKDTCYKGTRILLGNNKREFIDAAIRTLKDLGFQEIEIPIIQLNEIFKNKVGEENNNMMYNLTDRGGAISRLALKLAKYGVADQDIKTGTYSELLSDLYGKQLIK